VDHAEACTQVLDTADKLFYERGIQAVGMDELRTAAGVPLKRLYQCFPSKQHLIEAYLERRDQRWRAALADYVAQHAITPDDRPLAVFDWLHAWFTQPGFRGCAFINSVGELGTTAADVARIAHRHKKALQSYLTELTQDLQAHDPAALAIQLSLLVDGAITTAAITNVATAAKNARVAAKTLITNATTGNQ
jgi:AcrR family transcriptional regulator